MAEILIPERYWKRVIELLTRARAGDSPGGSQIVLNLSGSGQVTSVEWRGRDDGR